MINRKRSLGFGLEQLESRRPLAGDVAGVLGDTTCVLVENSGATSHLSRFAEVDDGFYLAAGDEVWKSTDNQKTADLVKKVPGRIVTGVAVNNRFLFTIETGDGFSGEDKVELWVSDGTEPGTEKLEDLGVWVFEERVAVNYYPVGDIVLMTVTNLNSDQFSLWTSDGTVDGSAKYADALWASGIHNVAEVNGDWYFVSREALTSNFALWRTDPFAKTTELVRLFNDPPSDSFMSPVFSVATTIGDDVYFSANDGETDYELWKSDGTPEGTVLVADINPNPPADSGIPGGSLVNSLTDVGGQAFFTADDGNGRELWTSDGTAAGTHMVADLDRGIDGMVAVGDRLYFALRGETFLLSELWSTDGTEAGTSLIKQLPGRIERSTAENSTLLVAGKNVFFTLDNGTNGLELWLSDGTTEGTVLAADINAGNGLGSSPRQLTAATDRLLFLASDGDGIDLWTVGLDDGVGSTGSTLPGDVNGNGEVEFQDFLALARNFGQPDLQGGIADGDFDEDGDVDFTDFLVLAGNFGAKLTDA